MVEYSAMTYALFFLGEYANMILMSAIAVTLFLGGWLPPFGMTFLAFIPGIVWFALKTMTILFFFIWSRATLPRFRYDQLMRLGWKVFLPFTLVWVVLIAGTLMSFKALPGQVVANNPLTDIVGTVEETMSGVEDRVERVIETIEHPKNKGFK